MSEPKSNLKKEMRILGLDTCRLGLVIGVVNRGGYFLDGVLVLRAANGPTKLLAADIIETKYFPELRAIMVHDPKKSLDINSIERVTKLPSILVSTGLKNRDPKYKIFHKNGSNVWFRTHLELSSACKILARTTINGRLPEPLRVAHLLAVSARSSRIR